MLQLIQISKDDLMKDFEEVLRKIFADNNTLQKGNETPDYYTRDEVSKLLKVSLTTLFHWNNQGVLKQSKIGRRVYYLRSEVEAKLQAVS